MIESPSYYGRCKTQNCSRSVDAQSQDGVGSVSLAFFAINAANTVFMTVFDLSLPHIMQDTRPTMIDAPLTLMFKIR